MTTPLPIAVFLSGGGRTLTNLLLHRDDYDLPIDIRLVISSSSKVRGVQIADDAGIPRLVVLKSRYPNADEYCDAMFDPVRESGATHVVMAGFLKHVLIPQDFANRVINIHPSLLPAYGGQGMYGNHVHQAVIGHGEETSGCTVHFVDNDYDQGPIILQKTCDVLPNDSVDELAARVFQQECLALPEAIRQIHQEWSESTGRMNRRVCDNDR